MKLSGKKAFLKELEVPPVRNNYRGTGKLQGHVALITGGDSGIGRSVAIHFAREGAEIAIVYLKSDSDAKETRRLVQQEGRTCLLLKGDVSREAFCNAVVSKTHKQFGSISILVNNAGRHEDDKEIKGITRRQLLRTFEVNIFPFF